MAPSGVPWGAPPVPLLGCASWPSGVCLLSPCWGVPPSPLECASWPPGVCPGVCLLSPCWGVPSGPLECASNSWPPGVCPGVCLWPPGLCLLAPPPGPLGCRAISSLTLLHRISRSIETMGCIPSEHNVYGRHCVNRAKLCGCHGCIMALGTDANITDLQLMSGSIDLNAGCSTPTILIV